MSTQTYTGSCHCGAVAFEVDADLSQVVSCNCSHCSRKGFLLNFVPAAQFRLQKGIDAVTEYLFNKKTIRHQFCKTCGVQAFGKGTAPDGTETVAVNVRCLHNVDVDALLPQKFDGKNY